MGRFVQRCFFACVLCARVLCAGLLCACEGTAGGGDAALDALPTPLDAAPLDAAPVEVEATQVDLAFGDVYAGARACVNETCGVVGEDEVLWVRPPIRGDTFRFEVSRGDARHTLDLPFGPVLETLGIDPDEAVTERMLLGLYGRRNGECGVTLTSHVINNNVVSGTLPTRMQLETLCGPFRPM